MIDTDILFASERVESREVPHEKSQDEWQEPSLHEHQEHQPIIGLPIPVQQGNQGPLLVADAVGAWAIERMHARVFLIPLWPFPTHPHRYQSLWQLLQSMDGLFLPAGIGTDWYPLWKAGEPGPESWPILWEIALAQLASYIGMPILAIADGAEKWNSALGGKRGEVPRDLDQTAPFTSPETWDRHTIRVRAQSMLATVLQPALVQQSGEQKPWALPFLPMPHQSAMLFK
ncbi:hypothetical protein ccbrp13_60040 [Ktedonobacteria bacterium brp13]|nr:hypothetical protein ccbrp13_60040 [Ktedonobacteria bacterium brp13]